MINGHLSMRFSDDDRRRVEEAAARAGYRYVSAYVRDRALGRVRGETAGQSWAESQPIIAAMDGICEDQKQMALLLSVLFRHFERSASATERRQIMDDLSSASMAPSPLAALLAEFIPSVADREDA